jgi:outer membrane protein TolC
VNRTLEVLLVAACLASTTAAAADSPAPRRLTLQEAVSLAFEQNPDIQSSEQEVDAAKWSRLGALGQFGPKLRAEGNVLRWREELTLSFPLPAGIPITPEPMTLRAQTTSSLNVILAQPLTPLWSIFENYRLKDLGVDVASLRRDSVRRESAFQVTEAYFRVLQAQRLVEVSNTSIAQVTAQVQRARAFEKQGVVGRNDVLRAELGLAAAQQRLIQMQGNLTLARGRLAMLLGFEAATPLEPVEPSDTALTLPADSAESVTQLALAERAELREVSARVGQARAGHRAMWSSMLPQVSAVASYQRSIGSTLAQGEDAYLGLVATWDVWEWGASYSGVREASVRVRQAETGEKKLRDAITLDAQAAFVTFVTAKEALTVAEKAVTQAEENFRLQTARYEAAAATTFDVLDAESLLTQARAQLSTARYDSLIARAGISRAIGRIPGEGTP